MQGYAAAYARQAMAYIGQIIGYKAQWEEDGKRYMEKRNPGGYMFSNADLRRLIFPLIVEQILAVSVGMVDTMMVSSVGEAATSGVSLVDMVNTLFINIFAAVATGGAVVSSQYLGQKRQDRACRDTLLGHHGGVHRVPQRIPVITLQGCGRGCDEECQDLSGNISRILSVPICL